MNDNEEKNYDEFEDEELNLDEDFTIDEDEEVDKIIIDVESVESFDDNVGDETDFESKFKAIHSKNKHKMEGKHSLKRDTIFNGKIDEKPENDQYSAFTDNDYVDSITPEVGSLYQFEHYFNEDYLNQKNLERDVFQVLSNSTTINFTANRRKPNRNDFNKYFKLLIENLEPKYSKSEIFVTLAFYFSDNIFNLFKLLDKKHATSIITELKNKGHLKDIGNVNFV
jgi:hypothetical protein